MNEPRIDVSINNSERLRVLKERLRALTETFELVKNGVEVALKGIKINMDIPLEALIYAHLNPMIDDLELRNTSAKFEKKSIYCSDDITVEEQNSLLNKLKYNKRIISEIINKDSPIDKILSDIEEEINKLNS